MSDHIRITIVDDHSLLRRGLREALIEQGDFSIVGEGSTADEAVELAKGTVSDIMIMDVNMPGDGIAALSRVNAIPKPPKILILTIFDNLSNVRSAMSNGAYGYVLKGIEGDELATILRGIHAGKKHVGPELAAKLLAQGDDPSEYDASESTSRRSDRLLNLTDRESQILDLIGKGLNNLDIAKKLDLREATVKHYITPLFRKLGVRNRTEAALLRR